MDREQERMTEEEDQRIKDLDKNELFELMLQVIR